MLLLGHKSVKMLNIIVAPSKIHSAWHSINAKISAMSNHISHFIYHRFQCSASDKRKSVCIASAHRMQLKRNLDSLFASKCIASSHLLLCYFEGFVRLNCRRGPFLCVLF